MKPRLFITDAAAALFAAVALSAVVMPPRIATAQTPTKSVGGAALSAEGMQAFRTLQYTSCFAVGGVGIVGSPSDGETALRVLLKEKNGPVVLRALFKSATPAGKLYALLGLKPTGTPREVAEVARALRASKTQVSIQRGCVISGAAVGTLAAQIENGKIVLPPERVKPPAR